MSQRDLEDGLEKARGHFGLSKSTVSELTDTLTQAYAALRTRDLSGDEVASLFREIPCRNPYGGGGGRRGGCACGRSASMGARWYGVSRPPTVRVMRVVSKCCAIWGSGGCRRPSPLRPREPQG